MRALNRCQIAPIPGRRTDIAATSLALRLNKAASIKEQKAEIASAATTLDSSSHMVIAPP
jgi:hypothetical protein